MDFFRKYGIILLTGAGLLASLLFYSLNIPRHRSANVVERSVQFAVFPLMKPFISVSRFIDDAWGNYFALVDVRKENLRLKDEIRVLNARLMATEEVFRANQRLNRMLDMKTEVKAPTLSAMVIGEDITSWFRTLVIDRGSSSGLRDGMAVLAADGVVGQIVKVAPETSRVLLLTDHVSGISVTIQRSRARGVVKGKGEGICSMEFTTREEDVKVGDQVVTSGVGGLFLKGLPVGEVTMVKRGEYGIFQTVTIRPAVNLDHLEEVLVVMRGGYE